MATRRTTSVRPGQFKHLTALHSFVRVYQSAIWPCCGLLTTGIRVTELALLEVADLLYPSGAIKPEVNLRAYITKGCKPRNIYLTHSSCLSAHDAWIEVRHRRRRRIPPMANIEACAQVRSSSFHKGQSLNSRSNIASWPAARSHTVRVMRYSRRSPGFYRQAAIKHGSSHSGIISEYGNIFSLKRITEEARND